MGILNSKSILCLILFLLCSCSSSKTTSTVSTATDSLVLADGITVKENEIDDAKRIAGSLDQMCSWASPESLLVERKILALGTPSENFKNDATMQAIMNHIGEMKSSSELISLIKINKTINEKELAKKGDKNLWLCRLTRSTIWLCSVRGSLMYAKAGAEVLQEAKSALEPLDDTQSRDFAGMEKYQNSLK